MGGQGREHNRSFQDHLTRLLADAGLDPSLAPQLAILAEGAQTTAAIEGSPEAALHARRAAETLIDAYAHRVRAVRMEH